jgi:phage terminase large subunit
VGMYQLNPYLRGFWTTPARVKTLEGGRASSKSHDAAGFAVYLAANYTLKFMCARQFQNKISESVYTLLKNKINDSEYAGEFEILKNSITHKRTGSSFIFYGIARNLNEIKSTEGIDILWLEEAQYLTEEQWVTIEATIRKQGSQIWVIFNPDEYLDFAYQRFVVDPMEGWLTKEINWNNNPFLSQTALDMIHALYKSDPELAEHVYGGKPKMGQDKSVIPLLYILAAVDAHKFHNAREILKPENEQNLWVTIGRKRIGFDIADDGDDLCATIEMHGNIAIGSDEWQGLEDELLKSSQRVYDRALETGSEIVFDSIGVGAQAGPKFKEMNDARGFSIVYEGFNAGAGVMDPDKVYMKLPHQTITNKQQFANVKAQVWREVSNRFRKTYEYVVKGVPHPIDQMISIDSSCFTERRLRKIQQELSAPRKDKDGRGLEKVESKDDMRTRQVKSPNLADAFIMACIQPKRAAKGFFT